MLDVRYIHFYYINMQRMYLKTVTSILKTDTPILYVCIEGKDFELIGRIYDITILVTNLNSSYFEP